ncbi:radical SAM protein [Endothiovibrio diazotrophicus]
MRFVLYGSLGLAEHILEALDAERVAAVVDDDERRLGAALGAWRVEPLARLGGLADCQVIVATLDFAGAMERLRALGIGAERICREVWWDPFLLQVEPTTRCNLACSYCTREGLPEARKSHELSAERLAGWLDELPRVKRVHLQGLGEPLLNRDLGAMIEACAGRGIAVSLTSNAMAPFHRLTESQLQALDRLVVSVDESGEGNAFVSRIGGTLEKLEGHLGEFLWLRGDAPVRLSYNYVVGEESLAGIPRIARWALRHPPQELHFHLVENWKVPGQEGFEAGRAAALAARAREAEIVALIEAQRAPLAAAGVRVTYTGSAPRRGACHWPFAGMFLSCDGWVTPCCIRMEPEFAGLGKAVEGGLRAVWFGEGYRRFRQSMFSAEGNAICNFCPQ